MPTLTKEQIELLEYGGWYIESMEPFKMSFDEQFCGSAVCTSFEEALEEIEQIKVAKDFHNWLKSKKVKDGDVYEANVDRLKDATKLLLSGITQASLLNFFNASIDFHQETGDTFLAEDIEVIFKDAFDEVDPP